MNRRDIAAYVGTKSERHCVDHYMKCYLAHSTLLPDPSSVLSDTFQGNCGDSVSCVETFNTEQVAPLSPLEWIIHSYTGPGSDISGYNPLRDDYDVEYDNDAEMMLKDVEIIGDEDEKEKELKTCMLRAFNRMFVVILIIMRLLNVHRSFARTREAKEVCDRTWPSGPEEHYKRRKEETKSRCIACQLPSGRAGNIQHDEAIRSILIKEGLRLVNEWNAQGSEAT